MKRTFQFDYSYKTKTGTGRAMKSIYADSEYAAIRELEKYNLSKGQELKSIFRMTVSPPF